MPRTFFRIAAMAAAVVFSGATLHADSIYLFNPDGSPRLTPFWDNITILKQSDKSLVFRTASGKEQSIEFEKVARLTVTADPLLTAADDAFTLAQFDKAVDGYLKAIRTNDAWKIQWITPRLSQAATKTSRFDAALTAYLGYARIDPPAAVSHKPTLPAKGSKFLDDGAKQLDAAVRSATSNAEKQALLSLLLDVQMARGDNASAEATANQLMTLSGDQTDPRIAKMVVGIRLDQAAADIEAGRYDQVDSLIAPVRSKLTEPAQQARAMFLIAQSLSGTAGGDNAKRIDAAIAFMRVVAHFSATEGKPFVGESLFRAATLNESMGDIETARILYEQLEAEMPGTSLAQQASSRRESLKK